MMFTKGEIETLGLCALCKDLPAETDDISEQKVMDDLVALGLIRKSNCALSYRVTDLGFDYLQSLGFEYSKDKNYLGKSKALSRRLETAKITKFFLKGGANVSASDSSFFDTDNVFVPSFTYRRKTFSNLLGGTRLGGFYYLRDMMFVPYFIAEDNNGIYTDLEERTFNCETVLRKYNPVVLLLSDGNLGNVLNTSLKPLAKREKVNTDSYLEAIKKFRAPVALITLDSNGLDVINIISVKDYRTKIARLILLNDYEKPTLKYSDGVNIKTKENFIVGIDSNITRMKEVINNSTNTTHILLLPFQQNPIGRLLKGENARLHTIKAKDINSMLGISNREFLFSNEPYITKKGGYAYVPTVRQTAKIRR